MKRLLSLLMLLIFTLSLALPVSAASVTPGGPGGGPSMSQGAGQQGGGPGNNQPGGGPGMGENGFAQQLSSLVSAGTITQAQADSVEAALKPSGNEELSTNNSTNTDPSSQMKTKLDALVTASTITSAQETAILKAIQPPGNEQDGMPGQNGKGSGNMQGNPLETALSFLVTAGTITQTVADTIISCLKPSEDNTSKTDMKTALTTELAALVSAGTITQDQSDAIAKVLQAPAQSNTNNGKAKSLRLKIGSSQMTTTSGQQDIDPGYATAPVVKSGTTFVPIRAIVELWGGTISWNNDTQTITITLNGNTVALTIGSTTATVNGATVTLSSAPYVSATGRTMVPIRFLAESLDLTVNWDQTSQSIDIQ